MAILTIGGFLSSIGGLYTNIMQNVETDPSKRINVNIGGQDGYFIPKRKQEMPSDPEYVLVE
jgi:hypothetical protein